MSFKKPVHEHSGEISIASVGSKCDSIDVWSSTENFALQEVCNVFNLVNYSCVNSNTNIKLSDIYKSNVVCYKNEQNYWTIYHQSFKNVFLQRLFFWMATNVHQANYLIRFWLERVWNIIKRLYSKFTVGQFNPKVKV
jgi:hypothetical protein